MPREIAEFRKADGAPVLDRHDVGLVRRKPRRPVGSTPGRGLGRRLAMRYRACRVLSLTPPRPPADRYSAAPVAASVGFRGCGLAAAITRGNR
jgi:hypothetical protein